MGCLEDIQVNIVITKTLTAHGNMTEKLSDLGKRLKNILGLHQRTQESVKWDIVKHQLGLI